MFRIPFPYCLETEKRSRKTEPASMSDENKLRVIRTTRTVMERKLLRALDDNSKVAILATKEDLDLLISALGDSIQKDAQLYGADLEKLRDAAFPTRRPQHE